MSTTVPSKEAYRRDLEERIKKAREAYYDLQPVVDDDTYDGWVNELKELNEVAKNPSDGASSRAEASFEISAQTEHENSFQIEPEVEEGVTPTPDSDSPPPDAPADELDKPPVDAVIPLADVIPVHSFNISPRLFDLVHNVFNDEYHLDIEEAAKAHIDAGFRIVPLSCLKNLHRVFSDDQAADDFITHKTKVVDVHGRQVSQIDFSMDSQDPNWLNGSVACRERSDDGSVEIWGWAQARQGQTSHKKPACEFWQFLDQNLDWFRRGKTVTFGSKCFYGNPLRAFGVATGDGFVIIDFDLKDGKDGLANLTQQLGEQSLAKMPDKTFADDEERAQYVRALGVQEFRRLLPRTYTVRTPSGGYHLYYKVKRRISGRKSVWAVGVDIQGEGQFAVAAGNIGDNGVPYLMEQQPHEIEWLPDETEEILVNLKKPSTEKDFAYEKDESFDWSSVPHKERRQRASAYLAKLPAAISGQNGHRATYYAAVCLVKGFGLKHKEALDMMWLEYNQRCKPPWTVKELEHKVNDAIDKGLMPAGYLVRPKKAPPPPSDAFRVGDHVEVARRFLSTFGPDIVATEGMHYCYQDGVWMALEPAKQLAAIANFSGLPVITTTGIRPLALKNQDLKGILEVSGYIATESKFFADAPVGLAFKNGFLRRYDDEFVLTEHSPDNRARYAYEFDYDVSAPCPMWEQFLASIWEGDADVSDKIACVQEFAGACLFGIAPKYKKCIILTGDTDSGKSTLLHIVRGLFPPGTTEAIGPADWTDEYKRAALSGKLINTVAELPAREWLETESFKAFIGDDPINARSIYQSPFTYHSKAGHIFAANELPRINDRTNATWNRMRVLQCNQRFAAAPNPGQKKAIDGLSDLILKTERPGITAWAIRGVQRLVTQHQYTNPESSAIAIGNWQKGSDQLEHFFEDQLQLSPDPKELLARTGVFKAYSDWARLNNHKGMSSTEFYKNFPKLLQKKGILNPTTKLNGQRAYRGICARPAERDTMLEPINPGRNRSVVDDEESADFFRKLN